MEDFELFNYNEKITSIKVVKRTWTQTDFESGILVNVDTSSFPGDVKLSKILQISQPLADLCDGDTRKNERRGQTFKALATNLSKAVFHIGQSQPPSPVVGDIAVKVWSVDASGYPDTELDLHGIIPNSNLPAMGSSKEVEATLSGSATLTVNENYAIVLEHADFTGETGIFYTGSSYENLYSDGVEVKFTGGTWKVINPTYDMYFKLYFTLNGFHVSYRVDSPQQTVYAFPINSSKVEKEGGWYHYQVYPKLFAALSFEQAYLTIFDTCSGTYPSIMGNHTGTIKPNHTAIATKLYTYPCEGTGGHTEYAEIRNATWNATATWEGYVEDWHNITFDKTVVLLANETYNYTIRTGSYPQIHHKSELPTENSWINCTKFTDANGRIYTDWIPAIRLE